MTEPLGKPPGWGESPPPKPIALPAGPDRAHPAFEAELLALCDKYGVQAAVVYGGYKNSVVARVFCASENQGKVLLSRGSVLFTDMLRQCRRDVSLS